MTIVEETRTPQEWLQAAEELSQRVVHLSAKEAYERAQQGQFNGTPFAAKLSQLMFLAGAK